MTIEAISSAIERAGLVPRGALRLEASERAGELAGVRVIVLAGMAGRDGWEAFAASPEARDGDAHPLDRWSRRAIEGLARELGANALFPFGGPPFWPFQQWARRAAPVHPSPIGLLIHPRHGLWRSYRGAAAAPSPCEFCAGRWCPSACPAGAFSPAAYDVGRCANHLRSAAGADCMRLGCRARRACPIGAEHAYAPDEAGFLMRAFLAARDAG